MSNLIEINNYDEAQEHLNDNNKIQLKYELDSGNVLNLIPFYEFQKGKPFIINTLILFCMDKPAEKKFTLTIQPELPELSFFTATLDFLENRFQFVKPNGRFISKTNIKVFKIESHTGGEIKNTKKPTRINMGIENRKSKKKRKSKRKSKSRRKHMSNRGKK